MLVDILLPDFIQIGFETTKPWAFWRCRPNDKKNKNIKTSSDMGSVHALKGVNRVFDRVTWLIDDVWCDVSGRMRQVERTCWRVGTSRGWWRHDGRLRYVFRAVETALSRQRVDDRLRWRYGQYQLHATWYVLLTVWGICFILAFWCFGDFRSIVNKRLRAGESCMT